MRKSTPRVGVGAVLSVAALVFTAVAFSQQNETKSRYAPVDIREDFESILSRMRAAKADVMSRQKALLEERYDLSDRHASGATMSRGKAVQEGVRVKLSSGMTWEKLAGMTPEQIRQQGAWPAGFLPLPHPNHPEGGMLFPKFHIDEIKKQEQRDLTRFDLDFDLPDHFLPEFPPPMFLTTRLDLGDVSKGKLVTIENFYELFDGILDPKQLEGLRLLVTPFPSSSSIRPKIAAPNARAAASCASSATSTGTRTRRRTWWATSGRRNSGIASTRRAFEA